jgi:hypothetical protein
MLVLVGTEIRSFAQAQSQASINANTSVQVALILQRAEQVERHLEAIDAREELDNRRINDAENELSQIRGFGIGIGALLSLFQVIQVILQLRLKKP